MSQGSILRVFVGKHLQTNAVEEPGSIVGCIRGQIHPVFVIVVREEPHVRHEDAGVDVHAVHDVPVIAAVGLAHVAKGGLQIELTVHGAAVVARDERRPDAELRHEAAAEVVVVEVSPGAHEGQSELVVARDRRRPDDRVVDRVGHRRRVVDVDEELGGEVGRVEHRLVLAARSVEPPEVREGEGLGRFDDLGSCRDLGAGGRGALLRFGRDAGPTRERWSEPSWAVRPGQGRQRRHPPGRLLAEPALELARERGRRRHRLQWRRRPNSEGERASLSSHSLPGHTDPWRSRSPARTTGFTRRPLHMPILSRRKDGLSSKEVSIKTKLPRNNRDTPVK